MTSQKLATVKQTEARKMKQKTENLHTWQSLYRRLIVRVQSSTNFYHGLLGMVEGARVTAKHSKLLADV